MTTSFSPDWLFLREPADHRARNADVCEAAVAAFKEHQQISIVDLACGTGSNLRGLAPLLPLNQTWSLVDSDPVLLSAAQARLIAVADNVKSIDPLILEKNGRLITVHFMQLDLRTEFKRALQGEIGLVTAAAFFDLVSQNWIIRFCETLSRLKLPLYATLIYSGEGNWSPHHPADAAVLAAFHKHQSRDKGFGPAAGPQGATVLVHTLTGRGYSVSTAASPWRLCSQNALHIEALVNGISEAVSETGLVPETIIADWRAARIRAAQCEIGHIDLFAVPCGRGFQQQSVPRG